MSWLVVFEKQAEKDLQQAIDYYDRQQLGLGEKFWLSAQKHIDSITKNPFFQIRYGEIRCLPLKKFPFMIYFLLDEEENTIYILSIFHTSQNPGKWPKV
jgi:toxin ParE1/3/4